jgi:hypothetical protein
MYSISFQGKLLEDYRLHRDKDGSREGVVMVPFHLLLVNVVVWSSVVFLDSFIVVQTAHAHFNCGITLGLGRSQ